MSELSQYLNLQDLIAWLEYGKETGYRAARCSKEQEEYWAKLLREKLRIDEKENVT